MADNITHATAAEVATDDIGARHFQWVKLKIGGEGTANDPSASDPLPVRISDGDAFVPASVLYPGDPASSGNFTVMWRADGTGLNSDNVSRKAADNQTGTEWELNAASPSVQFKVHGLVATADAETRIRFLDGSGGSAISGWYQLPFHQPPSAFNLSGIGTVNTALYVAQSNASATVYMTAWIALIA